MQQYACLITYGNKTLKFPRGENEAVGERKMRPCAVKREKHHKLVCNRKVFLQKLRKGISAFVVFLQKHPTFPPAAVVFLGKHHKGVSAFVVFL